MQSKFPEEGGQEEAARKTMVYVKKVTTLWSQKTSLIKQLFFFFFVQWFLGGDSIDRESPYSTCRHPVICTHIWRMIQLFGTYASLTAAVRNKLNDSMLTAMIRLLC